MSYPNHIDPDGYDDPGLEGTGIFPILDPLPAAAAEAEAGPERSGWLGPERWLIAGGTVVAAIAAFVAFTAGSPPVHAMPSPFSPAPAAAAHAQPAAPATCGPM